MDIFVSFILPMLISAGISGVSSTNCTSHSQAALEQCVAALKSEFSDDIDAYTVVCSASHRRKLDCVIANLNQCPDAIGENFMTEFQDGDFKAAELLTVTSADTFCDRCVPARKCLKKVDFTEDGFRAPHNMSLWKQINPKYVCGDHKSAVECVGRALPDCNGYFQYKEKSLTDDDVRALQNSPKFIEDQCHRVGKEYDKAMLCTTDTSLVLRRCSGMMETYKEESKRMCGVRHCITMEMEQCHPDWVEMFIESINVYRKEKIPPKPCPVSGAVTMALSLLTFSFSLMIVRF